jgi:hypothetical protein
MCYLYYEHILQEIKSKDLEKLEKQTKYNKKAPMNRSNNAIYV